MENDFNKMLQLDVSSKVEKKQSQNYLSWTYAWSEFKKVYKDASYRVIDNDNGMPYFSSNLGIMVKTEVTANGETLSMWLPCMNESMKALKEEAYTYKVAEYVNRQKTGKMIDKYVEPANMFNINKTIMRCLTKNIAMFGLGLFVYSGEDVPEEEMLDSSQLQKITNLCKTHGYQIASIAREFGGYDKIANIPAARFDEFIAWSTPK